MASDTLWHLDKKVPIGIIGTVLMQCAVLIWWANGITKDSDDHARRLQAIEAQRASERITVLESQMIDLRGSLQRIEGKLDRLIETRPQR